MIILHVDDRTRLWKVAIAIAIAHNDDENAIAVGEDEFLWRWPLQGTRRVKCNCVFAAEGEA